MTSDVIVSSDVIVAGGSVQRFGRCRDGSTPRDWARAVVDAALDDAEISLADIDAVVVGYESDHLALQLSMAAVLADTIGAIGKPLVRVEAGGATGAAAIRTGWMQIRAGDARRVLVVGVEHVASHLASRDVEFLYGISFDADFEGFAGATATALYALSIRDHMRRHGTTEEDFARVSVKNAHNAMGNPWARRQRVLSISDVLASPIVWSPYKRLDCSAFDDGAAAIVLARGDLTTNRRPVTRIASSTAATDFVRLGDRENVSRFAAKHAAAMQAYAVAGIRTPLADLACAEVYDAYSGAELQAIEALGLAHIGGAAAMIRDGVFNRDGWVPVNNSGGLLGQGGAPGATGIAQVVAVDRMLTGRYHVLLTQAGQRRFGLAEAHGGLGTVSVVHILERLE